MERTIINTNIRQNLMLMCHKETPNNTTDRRSAIP